MAKILDISVGTTGYGLMGFNIPPTTSPESAIPVMKHAFESGARFWSSAEFYGTAEYNSVHLVAAYFKQYPEHAAHVILSLKIGMNPATMTVAADEESIRKSYENCARILDGAKKIDVITCARVDPEIPVEVSVGALNKLVEEGKAGAVGMSECGAATLRRAAKVCKIVAVEVEFSLFTTDILTNGVAEAAKEAGAVIAAYSPLGRGVLTGTVTSETFAENDPRRRHPRLAKEALENNMKLVNEIDVVAQKHGATKGQIALAWVRARSGQDGMPYILPIPGTKSVGRLDDNMKEITLTSEDVKILDEIVKKNPVLGDRYPAGVQHLNWG